MQDKPASSKPVLYETLNTLNFNEIEQQILAFWQQEKIFEQSVANRQGADRFTFYEGPPSANGLPGIHHVMARAIKDIFCRYQTLKGKQVPRRAGWDTHGLPIELQVEKRLGITKKDIGVSITVEEYNRHCKAAVLEYKSEWDALTERMGYWVDLQNPYITFTNDYIQNVWTLLKQLHSDGLLYEGYSIQPYSPAAGTGLSSHELNMPGTYKLVKDTSITAQFKVKEPQDEALYILAWTTTPWTLPANAALAVGERIRYVKVDTYNRYTAQRQRVILAKDRLAAYFNPELAGKLGTDYKPGDKDLPYEVMEEMLGTQLLGWEYKPLFDFELGRRTRTTQDAYRVIGADFVSTDDGTGIVHISPTFGADDARVARQNGIPQLGVIDEKNEFSPIVDLQGKYASAQKEGQPVLGEFAGRYVKNYTDEPHYQSLDEDIAKKLKQENKAFLIQKYEHNYPHCWRTDKPVLYYPLSAWFIKTTAKKDEMVRLNETINWKPASTGTGRFGNWLENLQDWNLSRSRYWGIPLPIWKAPLSRGYSLICIGSVEELVSPKLELITTPLKESSRGAILAKGGKLKAYFWDTTHKLPATEINLVGETLRPVGPDQTPEVHIDLNEKINSTFHQLIDEKKEFLEKNKLIPLTAEHLSDAGDALGLHKPAIDQVILIHEYEEGGKKQYNAYYREPDLIDVWFDSGAMPYAQWPFPYTNQEGFDKAFPADFIAEGVDQTRGWFFTLHAIATMTHNSVAFRNVVSNGLVLDKDGNKMSKRLGNAVDPFVTLDTYGADPTRWYMIENANPWENLRFNQEHLKEVQRRFFGTLFNTYQFYALYANIDNYPVEQFNRVHQQALPELDRWIISRINTLAQQVDAAYADYEPTRAARAIQDFVVEDLSNWYVRLCRRRFWKGEMNDDKRAAYQTLQHCLAAVAQLMSPIAPFFGDWLYRSLTNCVRQESIARNTPFKHASVHLTDFYQVEPAWVDAALEERMHLAQQISSLAHAIRKKARIKVRQPLQKLLIPVRDAAQQEQLQRVEELIMSEINVKEIAYLAAENDVIVKSVKANFKTLGPKLGPAVQVAAQAIAALGPAAIAQLEREGQLTLPLLGEPFTLQLADVEVRTQDIPGWNVATDDGLTVALDLTLTVELRQEGIARELVNRLQNLRKDLGFEVTDTIDVQLQAQPAWQDALDAFTPYICSEILASSFQIVAHLPQGLELEIEGVKSQVNLSKHA